MEKNHQNPALLPWILARALLAVSAAPQTSTDWEETPERFQDFVQHLQWQLSKVFTSWFLVAPSHLGKRECLPLSVWKGADVSFQIPCSPLCCCCCRRRRCQTTCLLPSSWAARLPGTHSMFEVGLRRWAGAHAGGEGRKVPNPTRGVLCPSTEEKTKIVPSFQL